MRRTLNALLALFAAALLALELGLRPLDIWPALLALYALILWRKPEVFLFVLPALLPLASLAQWTGALYAEEWDLFALLTAVLLYTRETARPTQRTEGGTHGAGLFLINLLAISYLIAAWRGLSPTPAFDTLELSGYHTSWNSLRIAKGFFYALLLWPLFSLYLRRNEEKNLHFFALGMASALALISLLCLWERMAFPGLLNLSSDYRSTALFWEMHVGGAALDGFFALTFPFALWAMLNARKLWGVALAIGLFALASYAIFTTFSRGLYGAYAAIVFILLWRQARGAVRSNWIGMAALLIAALPLIYVFLGSGYRGLIAAAGVLVAAVALSQLWPRLRGTQRAHALWGAMLMLVLVMLIWLLLPKGAYLAYAFSALLGFVAYLACRTGKLGAQWPLAAAAGMPLAAILIALHWANAAAAIDMGLAIVFALGLGGLNAALAQPLLPDQRNTWIALSMSVVLTGLAAVSAHSFYVAERFSTVSSDLQGREIHWRTGLDGLQNSTDWLLGKGLGRFPATYYWSIPAKERPGAHRILRVDGNPALMMSSPAHMLGYGQIYRVGQEVSRAAQPPFELRFDVRTETDISMVIEVCQKHLLYNGPCHYGDVRVSGHPGQWQPIRMELIRGGLGPEAFYAPRLRFFSLGITASERSLYLDNLSLRDATGQEMIVNGNFSDANDHWFFTSDRHHLPWHIKNLWLNYLFDQGVLGLVAFSLILAGAMGRLIFRPARAHPFAPYLLAGLCGFAIVGLFDSLVDVPRLSFLFFLLLFAALSLNVPRRSEVPA